MSKRALPSATTSSQKPQVAVGVVLTIVGALFVLATISLTVLAWEQWHIKARMPINLASQVCGGVAYPLDGSTPPDDLCPAPDEHTIAKHYTAAALATGLAAAGFLTGSYLIRRRRR